MCVCECEVVAVPLRLTLSSSTAAVIKKRGYSVKKKTVACGFLSVAYSQTRATSFYSFHCTFAAAAALRYYCLEGSISGFIRSIFHMYVYL